MTAQTVPMASNYLETNTEEAVDLTEADLLDFVPPILKTEIVKILNGDISGLLTFKQLRERRKSETNGDMTMKYLATLIGVSKETVKGWEGHQSLPTGSPLLELAYKKALKCTHQEMMNATALALEGSIERLAINRERKLGTGEIKNPEPRAVRLQAEDIED